MKVVVAILAGSMAERLCSEYGDGLDPDEVAKLAGEAWSDCLRASELRN